MTRKSRKQQPYDISAGSDAFEAAAPVITQKLTSALAQVGVPVAATGPQKVEYLKFEVGAFNPVNAEGEVEEHKLSFRRTDIENTSERVFIIDSRTIWDRFNAAGAFGMLKDGVISIPVVDGIPQLDVHVVHNFEALNADSTSPVIYDRGNELLGYINAEWFEGLPSKRLTIEHSKHGRFSCTLRAPYETGWFGLYRIAKGVMECSRIVITLKEWFLKGEKAEQRRHSGLLTVIKTHDFASEILQGTALTGHYSGIPMLENKRKAVLARAEMSHEDAVKDRDGVLDKTNQYVAVRGDLQVGIDAGEVKPTVFADQVKKLEDKTTEWGMVEIYAYNSTTKVAEMPRNNVKGTFWYQKRNGKYADWDFEPGQPTSLAILEDLATTGKKLYFRES